MSKKIYNVYVLPITHDSTLKKFNWSLQYLSKFQLDLLDGDTSV